MLNNIFNKIDNLKCFKNLKMGKSKLRSKIEGV